MTMTDIETVRATFAGMRSGDVDTATQYIDSKRFVQHNPQVADGVEGVKEFIRQMPPNQLQLSIIRAILDGTYVVTQSTTEPSRQDLFFDIFRLQDGMIVEQWAFSAEGAPPNQSGHTQTDGPTQPKPDEDTEKNKAFVRNYYQTVHISRDESNIQQYFSGDRCIRHEPGVRDGVSAFLSDMHRLIKNRTIDEIKFVLGQGDSCSLRRLEPMKANLASTSTCTESKTASLRSAGDWLKQFRHATNRRTKTACSKSTCPPPVEIHNSNAQHRLR